MDFLLVFAEWLDLGLTGMGVILGLTVYRRRYLITDTLWWIRQQHRQQVLIDLVESLKDAGVDDIAETLAMFEKKLGHSLSDVDKFLAHRLIYGINYRKSQLMGGDGDEKAG